MSYFRHPKTTAEKRANDGVLTDGADFGPEPGESHAYVALSTDKLVPERTVRIAKATRMRSRRGYGKLPSAWDDVHREVTRSWKSHRATQWR